MKIGRPAVGLQSRIGPSAGRVLDPLATTSAGFASGSRLRVASGASPAAASILARASSVSFSSAGAASRAIWSRIVFAVRVVLTLRQFLHQLLKLIDRDRPPPASCR